MSKPKSKLRGRRADSQRANEAAHSRVPRAALLALGAVILLAALRPVSAEDLWWQAARGRVVVADAQIAPSALLLIDETEAEADWLGGTVLYLLVQQFGFLGPTFSRLILISLAAYFIRPAKAQVGGEPWYALAGVLAVAGCEPGLLLAGRGWDLLFACALWRSLRDGGELTDAEVATSGVAALRPEVRFAVPAVITCLWMNFGPLASMAIPIALLAPTRRRWPWIRMLAVVIGGSLNPIGVWGWWDSSILLAPWTTTSAFALAETAWAPPGLESWSLTFLIGLAATATVFAWGTQRVTPRFAMLCCFAIALGLSSEYVIPLACVLLLLSVSGDPENAAADMGLLKHRAVRAGIWFFALLLSLGTAIGVDERPGLGWGVAPDLEPRLFAAAASDLPAGGVSAWSDRAVGAAVWTRDDLLCLDFHQRAIVRGRLDDWRLGWSDVCTGRKTRYVRSDGSLGGWWLWLQSREHTLVGFVVSSEEIRAIEALEATMFRPLSVDSPVIPYANSMDRKSAGGIVRTMAIRTTVNSGDWSYEPPLHGELFWDLRSFLGWHDRLQSRQSRVFRAMGLPIAALRVLRDERRRADLALECHIDLARLEVAVMGRPSSWRLAVLQNAGVPIREDWQTDRPSNLDGIASQYRNVSTRSVYDAVMRDDSPEAHYAAAYLLLEMGDATQAKRALRSLLEEYPDDIHSIGARDALRSL